MPNPDDRSVNPNGPAIRSRRKAQALPVAELACISRLSEKTIRNAELGRPVQIRTLRLLAEALECDFNNFLLEPLETLEVSRTFSPKRLQAKIDRTIDPSRYEEIEAATDALIPETITLDANHEIVKYMSSGEYYYGKAHNRPWRDLSRIERLKFCIKHTEYFLESCDIHDNIDNDIYRQNREIRDLLLTILCDVNKYLKNLYDDL